MMCEVPNLCGFCIKPQMTADKRSKVRRNRTAADRNVEIIGGWPQRLFETFGPPSR
jgi:hypothetical protein